MIYKMNRRGVALIISFIVLIVLAVLGTAILARGISERNITQRYKESTEAFWLAESGVNKALYELRIYYDQIGTWSGQVGSGSYSVDVANEGTDDKKVTSYGYVPAYPSFRAMRKIEAIMIKKNPTGFYDYAVYSAGDVDFNGSSYEVNNFEDPSKAVVYGGDNEIEHMEYINEDATQDTSISPLARLDFEKLYEIATRQGYVYDADRLQDVQNGSDSFPSSFWNAQGTDGIDNDSDGEIDEGDEKINIVYVTTDLQLNGDIGNIGGFYVVVGDVINTPNVSEEATINGSGEIDGAIYTRGTFRVNGGAGGLNVDGGIWSGTEARINGNCNITYNQTYMNAIGGMELGGSVQISSWRDLQNPYETD